MTSVTNYLDDRALTTVDAIQVENPWMLQYAKAMNGGRQVDLKYAPPGVNSALFTPILDRKVTDDPYILCVGRLHDPRKNINLLLEAYSSMPEGVRARVRLVLAGATPPPESFWALSRKLGVDKVNYIAQPTLEALVRLYQHAAVFALSSDEEGLGVVVLEAMSCGVPVVSTRCGGPDGIIEDGKDGFLVSLDSPELMGRKLAELLTNPLLNAQMGRRARDKIELRYDERVTEAAFVDCWDRMLAKSSR